MDPDLAFRQHRHNIGRDQSGAAILDFIQGRPNHPSLVQILGNGKQARPCLRWSGCIHAVPFIEHLSPGRNLSMQTGPSRLLFGQFENAFRRLPQRPSHFASSRRYRLGKTAKVALEDILIFAKQPHAGLRPASSDQFIDAALNRYSLPKTVLSYSQP